MAKEGIVVGVEEAPKIEGAVEGASEAWAREAASGAEDQVKGMAVAGTAAAADVVQESKEEKKETATFEASGGYRPEKPVIEMECEQKQGLSLEKTTPAVNLVNTTDLSAKGELSDWKEGSSTFQFGGAKIL